MKLRRGTKEEPQQDAGPADPYAELFRITDRYKVNQEKKEQEEGSVTNSLAMLTAIPEVDLGMEYVCAILVYSLKDSQSAYSTRLKNIEVTEKAKRIVAEERKDRKRSADDEEHLAGSRCEYWLRRKLFVTVLTRMESVYRPNMKTKSDADILRDAKLEAMGLRPEERERRPHHDRPQMATDEMVSLHCRIQGLNAHHTLQVMERFKKRMRK